MKITILVVEDEARTRELLVTMLNSLNLDLHIIQAATVVAATRAIQQQKPSIVLLDIHLPDERGLMFSTLRRTINSKLFSLPPMKNSQFGQLKALPLIIC